MALSEIENTVRHSSFIEFCDMRIAYCIALLVSFTSNLFSLLLDVNVDYIKFTL